MKKLRIILMAGLFLAGCHKEPLPTPSTSEPVFYVSCSVNSVGVTLKAGKEGYAMEPGFSMDSNNVYVMEASLFNPACASCYGMKVMINDHMTSMPGEAIHIDSALKLGHYLFNDRSLNPTVYSVKLKPELPEDPTGNYKWIIAEPNHADVVYNGYTVGLNFSALTDYTVSLQYEDPTGCMSTHSNLLRLGAGPEVNVEAVRQSNTDMIYSFSASSANSPIVSYHWDFGDGGSSDLANPSHPFQPGAGYYTVTLTARDANGLETKSYYQVAAVVEPVCMANYDAVITPIPNTQAYSKVTVELHDPSGKVYSSRDFIQPAESSFEIISIEDYKASSDGLKTKRFKALFNCLLKTGSDEIRITNGEAVLAIGYE